MKWFFFGTKWLFFGTKWLSLLWNEVTSCWNEAVANGWIEVTWNKANKQTNGLIKNFGVTFCNFWVKIVFQFYSISKSNPSSSAMFFSALWCSVTLVPVGRARPRKIESNFKVWIESIFEVLHWINIPSIGLNQYSKYCIEPIYFEALDWTDILGIGLNQYFKYWIESLFEVLDWINILSIELNQYSLYWIKSISVVLDWINISGIGLNNENRKI